ncbi:MAG: hypothetical protein NTV68_04100 [Methanomicrobiales archaeon]|nr:hypothetical protein [Methanomicrobiales archaeon]
MTICAEADPGVGDIVFEYRIAKRMEGTDRELESIRTLFETEKHLLRCLFREGQGEDLVGPLRPGQ